jgi:hypothetical protein
MWGLCMKEREKTREGRGGCVDCELRLQTAAHDSSARVRAQRPLSTMRLCVRTAELRRERATTLPNFRPCASRLLTPPAAAPLTAASPKLPEPSPERRRRAAAPHRALDPSPTSPGPLSP